MIKAIIFDWGGVLIDNPADGLMTFCAKSLGIKTEILKEVFSLYEMEFQKGRISEGDLWEKICGKLKIKKPTSNSLWGEAVKNIFTDKKEIYQIVQILKNKGYKTGFLSNTEIPAMNYFYDNGYERYFDALVFSCAEKMVKPEETIYRIALKKLKVKPREAIFIDDKPTYIEAARKVGIRGILFKTHDQLKKELVLFSVTLNQ